MTIRDLINMGIDIDTELCVEVHIYDDEDNYQGTCFSFSGIEDVNCDTRDMIILQAYVTPTT